MWYLHSHFVWAKLLVSILRTSCAIYLWFCRPAFIVAQESVSSKYFPAFFGSLFPAGFGSQKPAFHQDISTTLNIYADVTKELKKKEFENLDTYFTWKQEMMSLLTEQWSDSKPLHQSLHLTRGSGVDGGLSAVPNPARAVMSRAAQRRTAIIDLLFILERLFSVCVIRRGHPQGGISTEEGGLLNKLPLASCS